MGMRERLGEWISGRSAVVPAWLPGVDNLWPFANYNGNVYPLANLNLTLPGSREEEIESNFGSYVGRGFKGNSVIFSIMRDRLALFSQARFQWRNFRTGDLFGNASLDILEHPWPNGATADLLARAITDADAAGNFYATRRRTKGVDRIRRMRPDWVTMVFGTDDPDVSSDDLDAEFLGIIYHPGGEYSRNTPEYLQRSQIAHFAPIPDPLAHVRGMSWLTPIVREVMADGAATAHKLQFFQNSATPNLVVKRIDAPSKEAFAEWKKMIEEGHAGTANAYKTLYLTNGADATVVGANLQQLEFKATQGAGETRMAAASGIHPAIAGLSEGLQGASLNAGNFGAARRLVADKTLWWLWSNFCGSMETLVPPPAGAQLWVDASDIPFLREDRKDAADIQQIKAVTIRQLVDAGYEPDSVVKAVNAEDMGQLVHSGLFSVQLQPPQPNGPPTPPVPQIPASTNGNGRQAEELVAASETRIYRELERLTLPTPITFSDGAFHVETPVTVNTPEQPGAVVTVNVPEQAPPVVNIEAPPPAEITVEAPPPAEVNVTIEPPPPAEVNVTVEPPPPAEITVNVEQEPPVVNISLPEQKSVKRRRTVKRDKGLITEILDTETVEE